MSVDTFVLGYMNFVLALSKEWHISAFYIMLVVGYGGGTFLYQLTKRVRILNPWHCQRAAYFAVMGFGMMNFPFFFM
ncbi:hypothetical protein JK211_14465 [Tatumella sp. JGM130]|uniref:hypothetical protein n=1 Tax=Tatumella sp. JGM130 TaxID=2799797 RepID=UPI001BB052B9|nr:hypothetical protein [Tatumella sp. JGM130]MBS0895218.1 hypothetical protein [Tatumella sp. JGM130]